MIERVLRSSAGKLLDPHAGSESSCAFAGAREPGRSLLVWVVYEDMWVSLGICV